MSIPKVSVVIPVYNAGEYLAPCIDSILAQTFKDFELILVDDGSTDNSGAVCDEYAAKDERIRVFHQENQGATSAGTLGLKEARGEWIEMSDDDDTMEADALESLYSMHEGTDLVIGFDEVPDKRLPSNATLEDCRHAYLNGELSFPMWAKLYRKSLLIEIFRDNKSENKNVLDATRNTQVFFKLERPPRVIYKHIYNYRRNPASISHVMKASVSYEEDFYRSIYEAVPNDQIPLYLKQIIFLKLNGLFPIAYSQPESLVDKSQPYLKQIRLDISSCGYHMSLKERIVMWSKSKMVIKAIGFLELARRSLKYRVKLARK